MTCGPVDLWNPQVVADRIRRGLDVFGTTEGGLLYRGPEYWEFLPPGTEGQVLSIVDGLPVWGPAPGAPTLWEDDFFEVLPAPTLAEVYRRYCFYGTGDLNPTIGPNGGLGLFNGASFTAAWTVFVAQTIGSVRGQNQFSEAKIGTSGSIHRMGVFVGVNTDGQYWDVTTPLGASTAYWLLAGNIGGQVPVLQKITNGPAVTMGAAFPAAALGTVIALTLTYGVGSNVLEVFYNGVSQGTRTDSTSVHPRTGLPGFGGRGVALNQGMEFRQVRSGLLSEF